MTDCTQENGIVVSDLRNLQILVRETSKHIQVRITGKQRNFRWAANKRRVGHLGVVRGLLGHELRILNVPEPLMLGALWPSSSWRSICHQGWKDGRNASRGVQRCTGGGSPGRRGPSCNRPLSTLRRFENWMKRKMTMSKMACEK